MQPADPAGNGSLAGGDLPWLHPELIDAVARRVLELVREAASGTGSTAAQGLMTVAEVAERLRVSPKWVYAHQRRLGAIKLGDGPKARLRFDAGAVAAELDRCEHQNEPVRDGPTTERRAQVKRTRRRLVSRPLPAVDGAARRA